MSWCNELKGKTPEQLDEILNYFVLKQDHIAAKSVRVFKKFYNKNVIVIAGRKVPHGTTGKVFWLGSYCNSPYGDPWGIYTTFNAGIKDNNGTVYFTNINNLDVLN